MGVCAVFTEKLQNDDFQFPYQDKYLSEKQKHFGFNRLFFKDPISYSYIPVPDMKVSWKTLVNELLKRIKGKVGL